MKYAVMDLEMCKVPKGYKKFGYSWSMETIQIGAVLLNEDYQVVDEFNTYVKPEFGRVDSYIENFTGISQADVMMAPCFNEAIVNFLEWLPADDVRCVSWSMSDPKQLVHEYVEKGVYDDRFEIMIANWIDCQEIFGRKMSKESRFSLEEALIAADIIPEGRAHDGLCDACNTARLFSKLEQEDELELNSLYKEAREDAEDHLSFSMGDLLAGIVFT